MNSGEVVRQEASFTLCAQRSHVLVRTKYSLGFNTSLGTCPFISASWQRPVCAFTITFHLLCCFPSEGPGSLSHRLTWQGDETLASQVKSPFALFYSFLRHFSSPSQVRSTHDTQVPGLSIWIWGAKLFFHKEVLIIECLYDCKLEKDGSDCVYISFVLTDSPPERTALWNQHLVFCRLFS